MRKIIVLFVALTVLITLIFVSLTKPSQTVNANNTPQVEQAKIFQSESYGMLENAYNTFMKDNVGKITLIERPRIFNNSSTLFTIFVFYKTTLKKE
jgi:hypothetical protein